MNGWKRTTVGEAFVTVTGNTPPKNDATLFGSFMPLVKPPELRDELVETSEDGLSEEGAKVARIAPPNSILVSCIGNLGKIGRNTVPVAFNQQINAILPSANRVVPEFLFYQVLSCRFKEQLEALSSGTTVPIVNKSRFNSIEIVLPPLAEQQRIVGVLDEVFAGLATAKANAEKNLQNARTLFTSHLQSVFTQRGPEFADRTLGDVCDLFQGLAINAKSKHLLVSHSSLPLLRIKDLRENSVEQYVAENGFPPNAKVDESEIIYTRTGQVGLVFRGRRGVLHNNCFKVRPRPMLRSDYLFWWLQNPGFRQRITALAGKAAQPDIPHSIFKTQPIIVPPLKFQDDAVTKLDALAAETRRLAELAERKLAALAALQKSLLHQAFTGQL